MRSESPVAIALALCAASSSFATDPGLFLMGNAISGGTSRVYGLSFDGSIASGLSDSPFGNPNRPGFRWTRETGRVDVPAPPAVTSSLGLSSDGTTMIGRMGTGQNLTAYRRVGAGPLQSLGIQSGYTRSYAFGASADGSVVVGKSERGAQTNLDGQAYRWTAGAGLQPLGYLRGTGSFSEARDVSDDGNIVIGVSQTGGPFAVIEGFRWTPSTGMRALAPLPGHRIVSSEAIGVSGDGRVIVGFQTADNLAGYAVRWLDGVPFDLGQFPGADHMMANHTNYDGSVILGTADGLGNNQVVIWAQDAAPVLLTDYLRAHGVPLPMDVSIPYCEVVSGDGRSFGGTLLSPSLGDQGFVATIPQPSIVAVGFAGAMGSAIRRRPR
ncbi:MAG: hypothetical protein JSR77_10640 [Planctomycetes bacterium]|nr:hypothetical protein [Planctomycetota bacterium]